MSTPLEAALAVAEGNGLSVRDSSAVGVFEGCSVSVHSQGSQSIWAEVFGSIEPALDLGLTLGRLRGRGRNAKVVTGNADLDGEFIIEADEPARARILFEGGLAALLVAYHRRLYEVSLHDAGCSIYISESGGDWVTTALGGVSEVAKLVATARPLLPVATPLAPYAPVFARFAEDWGLEMQTVPLVVRTPASGATTREVGASLEISATRIERCQYRLRMVAPFWSPLRAGLQLRRRTFADGVRGFFGEGDVELGDRSFDDRFEVSAEKKKRTARLLGADTRARLVELDGKFGRVLLDDMGICLESGLEQIPPSALPRALEQFVEVVRGLTQNAARRAQRGIYR
ncbi:MAG: hypothetical protein U0271_42875 [Polyangiaceae bacterium]